MTKSKKVTLTVLYSVNLFGQEFDGPSDPTLYDVVFDRNYFVIRYYGCCSVKTEQTLEDAKNYIRERAAFVIQKYKKNEV